ncbi:2-oxo acid dehydrogenase subunit E2 [Nesterenkonia salmonea]|uniref:Dihydrolipoamide acetyltransferase component of pyruvate dehydrogenase complex n=1 Tax=Nesterenkonia salmonea TaxID=1804987 RepID=A0A5R9BB17_9MICC|nr:dihydrolipoamide acetyltransferase family protein [Nesterenkonia salmonea]TLP97420.1 2-oxo acid dehydrogenase subunit E2 [Nesterenkonia salmonea]
MSQTFNLPDVGEGLTEAEIVSWRVSQGDTVDVNDVVCEIETAKSLVELPIPFAGTVQELVAGEGETIEVGQPLIRISAADSGGAPPPDSADSNAESASSAAPASEKPSVAPAEEHQQEQEQSPRGSGEEQNRALVGSGPKADAPKARPRTRPAALDLVDVSDLGVRGGNGRKDGRSPASALGHSAAEVVRRAAPPVRALAKRFGLDVVQLVGTGRDGRITREDVEAQAQQFSGSQQSPESVSLYEGPREEQVQVRGVRKATALNVSASASEVPHVSVFKEVDVTRMMELRAALRNDPAYENLSVSPMLFAAQAIIRAARKNPQVNATWHGSHYTLCNYVNLGIAAATPRGLVVPVIHDAQAYTPLGLAAALTALTAEAREGKTTPAQMQGGTVSITNIGSLGLDFGTPILPPGQASIVVLGAVRTKPWVVGGQIAPRQIMTIGGSFDHRLIDGDLAGAFISDVAAVMEQPGLLMA